jgi:microcystin-dependent protein
LANTSGNGTSPSNTFWAGSTDFAQFIDPSSINGPMNAGAIQSTGGSQPHDNMIPYLCIDFIISLFGIFPSQT